jgi:hypothetical protein
MCQSGRSWLDDPVKERGIIALGTNMSEQKAKHPEGLRIKKMMVLYLLYIFG